MKDGDVLASVCAYDSLCPYDTSETWHLAIRNETDVEIMTDLTIEITKLYDVSDLVFTQTILTQIYISNV